MAVLEGAVVPRTPSARIEAVVAGGRHVSGPHKSVHRSRTRARDSTAVLFPVLMQRSHGPFLPAKFHVHPFIQFCRKILVPVRQRFGNGPRQLGDLHQVVLNVGHQFLLIVTRRLLCLFWHRVIVAREASVMSTDVGIAAISSKCLGPAIAGDIQRTVTFAIDDDPATIAERVRETLEARCPVSEWATTTQ
jgi:hypothetical protein